MAPRTRGRVEADCEFAGAVRPSVRPPISASGERRTGTGGTGWSWPGIGGDEHVQVAAVRADGRFSFHNSEEKGLAGGPFDAI